MVPMEVSASIFAFSRLISASAALVNVSLPVYIHQIHLCLANFGVLCPIKDICLRSLGKSIGNQFLFHKILHLFYVRYLSCRNGFHHFIYQFFKLDPARLPQSGQLRLPYESRCGFCSHRKVPEFRFSFLWSPDMRWHFPSCYSLQNYIWYFIFNPCTKYSITKLRYVQGHFV